MTRFLLLAAVAVITTPAFAAVEKEYDPSKPRVTTPWIQNMDAPARAADMDFIKGMRPHHAGALTMSREYLDSQDASNKTLTALARGIIRNQTFEIGVLDSLEHFNKQGGKQIAAEGQAQVQRFQRAPMPAVWGSIENVSARDVQFAKAMIIHHQGALDMANDYLKNANAKNGYLKKFCLDILVDQQQEIDLMNRVIAAYKGDADAVKITPDMVHGMEGMSHGGHGAAHKHH